MNHYPWRCPAPRLHRSAATEGMGDIYTPHSISEQDLSLSRHSWEPAAAGASGIVWVRRRASTEPCINWDSGMDYCIIVLQPTSSAPFPDVWSSSFLEKNEAKPARIDYWEQMQDNPKLTTAGPWLLRSTGNCFRGTMTC